MRVKGIQCCHDNSVSETSLLEASQLAAAQEAAQASQADVDKVQAGRDELV